MHSFFYLGAHTVCISTVKQLPKFLCTTASDPLENTPTGQDLGRCSATNGHRAADQTLPVSWEDRLTQTYLIPRYRQSHAGTIPPTLRSMTDHLKQTSLTSDATCCQSSQRRLLGGYSTVQNLANPAARACHRIGPSRLFVSQRLHNDRECLSLVLPTGTTGLCFACRNDQALYSY